MNMSLKNKFALLVGILMVCQLGLLWYALGGQEGAGKMLALGGGLTVVGAVLASIMAGSWVGKPLNSMLEHIKNSDSSREWVDIKIQDGSEVGELSEAINATMDKTAMSVGELSGCVDRIQVLSKELSNESAGTADGTQRQQREAQSMVDAISAMTATVHEVSQNATQAAQAARDANQEAKSGQDVVNSVTSAIHSLADEVERAATAIQKLEDDSESIGAILEVIRGIADQTNLLALNAAIEAARAGEQGRGFAVVADEVRTLAQRTQEATEEINDMIARLQEGSSNAVKVMAEGRRQAELSVEQAMKAGESLQTITSAVGSISEMNDQIARAVEQQTATSDNISENLSRMTELADQDASRMQAQNRLGTELDSAVGEMGGLLRKLGS